ncbi:hypothetical protein [Nonlabens ponticola]|uniref:Uncharacterized protein n=1 Tax=Nonlabens ponticola TaxID=2496866 RepID=A0A3S9MX50_9FLAO|nr:hypothetical protein [Nonlabens ponticola]AZQ43722.1 hypothetical protein EJ995_05575 [Nonlabens ponticola]
MNKVLFHEEQQFRQWWLWLIIIVVLIVPTVFAIFFTETMTTDWKIIVGIFNALLVWFLWYLKLETTITSEHIDIKYRLLTHKMIPWDTVDKAQVLDYGFVGGWGLRLWTIYGTVYNVSGSKGLNVKVGSKQYTIGTQKEEELRSSIAHLLK